MNIISTRDLGIKYDVYRSRTHSLKRTVFQFLSGELERTQFWALRNVTIEVHDGDALGVVGPNGAGKSTLCMALARILPPDEGEVAVRGTIAPLLSPAAGFNRDMTGTENIYLSGALMGRQPSEMKRMEEAIVSFADLGDFMQSPVRAYSSGMRARLAFAIATCVEPDVLILDEVLSVGDAAFRKKSEARMNELMDRARAVVLVSHSPRTIRRLCNVALWLHKGQVRQYGPAEEVLRNYEAWQGGQPSAAQA